MIIIQHILKDMLNLLEEQLNLYKIVFNFSKKHKHHMTQNVYTMAIDVGVNVDNYINLPESIQLVDN